MTLSPDEPGLKQFTEEVTGLSDEIGGLLRKLLVRADPHSLVTAMTMEMAQLLAAASVVTDDQDAYIKCFVDTLNEAARTMLPEALKTRKRMSN